MMLHNSVCKNHEIPDLSGGCSPTPQTIKVINSSNGMLTLLRSCGENYIPYSFSAGSLDYVPSTTKNSRENVTYYLSNINSRDMNKESSPYSMTLFDPHNLEVSPNPNYQGSSPDYQLEMYQNNRKVGSLHRRSAPLIVSTVPGGVIVVKIVGQGQGTMPGNGGGGGLPGNGGGGGGGLPGNGGGGLPPQQPLFPVAGGPSDPNPPPLAPIPEPEGTITFEPGRVAGLNVPNSGLNVPNSGLGFNTYGVNALGGDVSTLGASINSLNVAAAELNAAAKSRNTIWTWIGVGVAAIFVLLLIGFVIYFLNKNKKNKANATVIEPAM
nr:putative membrane protein [Cedratvirus lena]